MANIIARKVSAATWLAPILPIALLLASLPAAAGAGSGRSPFVSVEMDFNSDGQVRSVDRSASRSPAAGKQGHSASKRAEKKKPARDWKLAMRKQEALCESGSPAGCTMLGVREWDRGNYDRAHALFQVGCAKKGALACMRLGTIELERGRSMEAANAFHVACQQGDEDSCRRGINLPAPRQPSSEELGLKPEGPQIPRGRGARYELLCDGTLESCTETGMRAYAAQDLEKGVILLTGACDRGAVSACMRMAEIFQGNGDEYRLKEYLEKACDFGDSASCVRMRTIRPGMPLQR